MSKYELLDETRPTIFDEKTENQPKTCKLTVCILYFGKRNQTGQHLQVTFTTTINKTSIVCH